MTSNNYIENKSNDERKAYTYPLEKYMKSCPMTEMSVDFSTLGKNPLSEEDLNKLKEIKDLVKHAEEEINTIASSMSIQREQNIVHLEQPAYFDDNFDHEKYFKELVRAKMQGAKIIERENAATKLRKFILLKKVLECADEDKNTFSDIDKQFKQSDTFYETHKSNENTDKQIIQNKSERLQINSSKKKCPNQPNLSAKTKTVKISTPVPQEQPVVKKSTQITQKLNNTILEIKSLEVEETPFVELSNLTKSTLSVQIMPSLNIRSQLIEQKIPSLDIYPSDQSNTQPEKAVNVALIHSDYETNKKLKTVDSKSTGFQSLQKSNVVLIDSFENKSENETTHNKRVTAKKHKPQKKTVDVENVIKSHLKYSNDQVNSSYLFLNRGDSKNITSTYNDVPLPVSKNLSKLKKYGIPEIQQIYNPKSNYKRGGFSFKDFTSRSSEYMSNIAKQPVFLRKDNMMHFSKNRSDIVNNYPARPHSAVEYIPYSKLTVGGHNIKDIQLKGSEIYKEKVYASSSRSNVPLSQYNNDYLEQGSQHSENEDDNLSDKDSIKSDNENEENVSISDKSNDEEEKSGLDYVDDFDDDSKSTHSQDLHLENNHEDKETKNLTSNIDPNLKYRRPANLNFKKHVDVFDFFHHLETKDDSTQSCFNLNWNFKETQTSPNSEETALNEYNNNSEKTNKDEAEKLKNKKIDLANITLADALEIQKTLSALNTNIFYSQHKSGSVLQDESLLIPMVQNKSPDILSFPKNTQTSPCKTNTVMTSPTKMISRILSPVFNDTKVDTQTSPFDLSKLVTDEMSDKNKYVDFATHDSDDINYPKGILSNLESASNIKTAIKTNPQKPTTSKKQSLKSILKESTDAYTDISHSESSETHSLGEINLTILRKKSFLIKRQHKSDSNSTSFTASSSSDVQLDTINITKKSDGEMSAGQILEEN